MLEPISLYIAEYVLPISVVALEKKEAFWSTWLQEQAN